MSDCRRGKGRETEGRFHSYFALGLDGCRRHGRKGDTRTSESAESQQSTINQKSEAQKTSEWFQKRKLKVFRRGAMILASPKRHFVSPPIF